MATRRAAFIREELSTVEDPEDLKLITEACADGNQQWSDAASIALGASVCGASNYERIREWMSANSDAQMSTIVDYAESDPSWDLSETTGFPYCDHDDKTVINQDMGSLNSGSMRTKSPGPLSVGYTESDPTSFHLANQTPVRYPRLCTSPGCHRTFENIHALERHLNKDHNKINHWRCVIVNCLSRKGAAWTRFEDYRLHCKLEHPDQDANELAKRTLPEPPSLDMGFGIVKPYPFDSLP